MPQTGKNVVQIVSTFLTVGLGLLAAYAIFLFSSEANIDEEIQSEGAKIVSCLQELPVYITDGIPIVTSIDSLIRSYTSRNPEKGHQEILHLIGSDLLRASSTIDLGDKADAYAQNGKINLLGYRNKEEGGRSFLGRLFVSWVVAYLDYFEPTVIFSWAWERGRSYSGILRQPGLLKKGRLDLFPYGSYGVEKWSRDFIEFAQSLRMMGIIAVYLFDRDWKRFIAEEQNMYDRTTFLEFKFVDWYKRVMKTVDKMESHNNRVQTLLRLRSAYSMTARLPNLSLIMWLWGMSFLVGVILPLVVDDKKLETRFGIKYRAAFLVFVFTPLVWGSFLLWENIVSYPKDNVVVSCLIPLKEGIAKDTQLGSVDYDLSNVLRALDNVQLIKTEPKIAAELKTYRDAAIQSNICSEIMASMLKEAIQKKTGLQALKVEYGDHTEDVNAFLLLNPEERTAFCESLRKGKDKVRLFLFSNSKKQPLLTIKLPGSIDKVEALIVEIDEVYQEIDQYKELLESRRHLNRAAQSLLGCLHSEEFVREVSK